MLRHTKEEVSRLKHSLLLVGLGYFIFILADPRDGLAKISIQYLLKDHLHLKATQSASFFALVTFGWYCKPLAGLLTDAIPFLGSRRRGYLITASLLTAVLWGSLAFTAKSYGTMLWFLFATNIGLMIGQTTLGGFMVESGKALRATGRMASQRTAAENAGILISGLVGGWIAAHFLGTGFMVDTVLLAILASVFFVLLREPKSEPLNTGIMKNVGRQVKGVFTSKTMLVATLLWMLVRFSPGFQTPLFYYQNDVLGLRPETIGFLTFINGSCAVLASLVYLSLCRKLPLRTSLVIGVCCNLGAILCYLAYKSYESAMVVEGLYGFGNTMAFLPILDLLARATTKGSEALGYSLIFSFGNISLEVSNVLGSYLFELFHKNFMDLVWVNFGTSALVLAAIPFLPKVLVRTRDGQHVEPEEVK